ncbi:bifunctional 3'-5' exonuclease/DNA polymerase [Anaerotruncus sp. 2789STDY5834896]|uniref:DNA-directed DNA polymerase n=1 Tax=uncultured Anaerotruncus sp. TaxID=905011 RepID=A0A1C6G0X3_9FIRM|nr:bifunctional 3'-5' exonuclease/DNA polymerase [uncultured Anaerotruncus sp.]
MTRHLSIDLETYSSVDIKKAGMYKYVQSPDFEILLFAYSLDGGPVGVIDLTAGQMVPAAVRALLFEPTCLKHAYNAPFEWYCLSKYFDLADPTGWLPQWRCTMLHGLYCGYTTGLEATGKALGLPEDKRKLATGKALIKLFCTPTKPSAANGGRTRTLPSHEPEKWGLFVEYNRQDVVTEMEIERRLSAWPVPDQVQAEWVRDQVSNLRGVGIDMGMVEGAIACDTKISTRYLTEARAITGLPNPKSTPQLRAWLSQRGVETKNLQKQTVTDLLAGDLPDDCRRVLELRQELNKTSVKKYTTMTNAVCADGRVRGLLQFYGANRTGRWAGRLVQVQNLPRTYLEPLDLARELARTRQPDMLGLVYGSVPDTLSQLIRTALAPQGDAVYIDADFSAIEARVISWLAGEDWRLEVFRTHGRIYEASASQMFGVPLDNIVKGRPEYALRQKGKVAELALGYNGGPGALINMGALRMGLSEDELPDIVQRWRLANSKIRDLWYKIDDAGRAVIQTGRVQDVNGLRFALESTGGLVSMTIQLPSGRKLFYAQPSIGTNRWGGPSILYWGVNQTTRKWEQTETYGGKLTENVVQALARDCLALAIERLETAGYPVVFHVHDEVVIEVPSEKADLDAVCRIMGQPVPWAPGLPLKAEGWIGKYYKKD